MSHFIAELFGTMILIILGDGVVANVVLNKTKAQNSGWIVITSGWALAVGIPVYIFGPALVEHILIQRLLWVWLQLEISMVRSAWLYY